MNKKQTWEHPDWEQTLFTSTRYHNRRENKLSGAYIIVLWRNHVMKENCTRSCCFLGEHICSCCAISTGHLSQRRPLVLILSLGICLSLVVFPVSALFLLLWFLLHLLMYVCMCLYVSLCVSECVHMLVCMYVYHSVNVDAKVQPVWASYLRSLWES